MKTKIVVALLASTLWCISTFAQLNPAPSSAGNITVNASTCATTNACVVLHMASSNVGYSVTASGTWTGTLTVEQSGDNQGSWTSATTTTANTLYTSALTPGITDVRVRGSAAMTGTAIVTITASGPATLQQIAGGSSSSTSTGPVINVTNPIYAGGVSSANADNNAQLTSAFLAANGSTSTVPPADIRVAAQISLGTAATSVTTNATSYKGDTIYVFITDSLGQAMTVTGGGNTFTQVAAPVQFAGCCWMQIYKAANASGIIDTVTATTSPSENYTVAVITVPGALSETVGTNSTGSSTAPSITQTTSQANSMVVSSCSWFNGATPTLSSNTGILRTNQAAGASSAGAAVFATFSASAAAVTNSGTLSGSSSWLCRSIEVKTGGTTIGSPTVYVPAGYYFYSGGINPTIPMTLKCEPGTFLHYTGSAHAADLGPLAGYAAGQGFLTPGFYVDGCAFTGGSQMTQGIVMNNLVTVVGIRNSTFINFGNANSDMIYGVGENWDVEIGPQNRFITDDFQPRHALFSINNNATSFNSFVRIHDNNAFCLQGHGMSATLASCTAGQAGIGFIIDSLHSRVYHNNIAFLNPDIWLRCSNTPCTGNNIESNQLETPQTAGTGTVVPPIQFSTGNDQLLVINNSVWLHSNGSFIGPRTGTDTLTGARISWNQVGQIALATPLIALNNVAGNTANQSLGNGCSTSLSGHIPCALLHTVGGSIGQWDSDRFPSCTLVAGTCTVTLSQNFGVLPRCTTGWNGVGALAGILKAVPTAGNPNTVVVTSSNAADTAGVQLYCSAGDAQ